MKKGGKNKKSLSSIKKKNITYNKLSKQGVINKDAKRKRQKQKRKEERRTYYANVQEQKRKEAEMEPEQEITGQEMMEMMDKDDLNTLLKSNSKDKGTKRKIEDIEEEGREFNAYKTVVTKDGRELKRLLPLVTEEGVQEKLAFKSKDNKGLTLSKYKRARGHLSEETPEDEDSGIGGEDLSDDDIYGREGTEQNAEVGGEKSVTQILAERKRFLHEQKVKMACLALNVIQDPTKSSNLRFLLNMLKSLDPKADVTIFKYALYTILQVFHDMIPGYRIQENTLENRMRKEKYMTARQELDFIEFYRVFLKKIEQILCDWKKDPNNKGLTVLSETAVYCMGDLLVKHPYFNYTVNVAHALVPLLDNKHTKIRTLAFDALTHTVRNDKSFYLSLEIVRKIDKLAYHRSFRIREEVLKVFLALRGSEMRNSDQIVLQRRENTNELTHKEKLVRKLGENFRQKTSRKQKREKKKMAKITKQMESINVAEMKNIENERHSEIIQTIFGLYIHILKKRASSKLMSAVLEGLAKFAHLVNVEFFSDLLTVMNEFLENGTLGLRESLHCIQTVFTILSGQGEDLTVDPLRFYNQFYRILIEMNLGEREENIEVILVILEQMLVQRRKRVSIAKVLSFTKRVATLCLLLSHHVAIPVLVKLKKLFSMFSVTEALLDPDPEGCPGMFLPEVSDPENSNSGATAVWEMVVCQRSFHPSVALLAKNIVSGVPAREVPAVHSISDKSTKKLLQIFSQSDLSFNPEMRDPTTHLKTVKKRPLKRLIQDGELDLEDLKLQSLCENVLEEEEGKNNGTKGVNEGNNDNKGINEGIKKKKLKSRDSLLNFYDNIFNAKENPMDIDGATSLNSYNKDFTKAFVDVE